MAIVDTVQASCGATLADALDSHRLMGVPLSLVVATLVEPMRFGLSPFDPITLAAAIVLLTAAGLLAASWPAFRASRLNPIEALREG